MTRSDYFQSGDLTKLSSMNYFLSLFNYLDSDVLPYTFCVEDYEIHSQPHSIEYDGLVPDLTKNIGGNYILTFLVDLITPVTVRTSV